MAETLVIRADAGLEIGAGHLTRCLALAHAWRGAGGRAVFVIAETLPALAAEVARLAEVVEITAAIGSAEDASETLAVAARHAADWVVLDGHQFSSDYLSALSCGRSPTLVIDDTASLSTIHADALLNHNASASAGMYARSAPGVTLLLGPRYLLLRESFLRYRGVSRDIPKVASRVLVTLGGGDINGDVATVLDLLAGAGREDLDVVVATGFVSSARDSLAAMVRSAPFGARLAAADEDQADLMSWADVAVTGGGTSSLELAFMGVPSVTLVLDENQRSNAVSLEQAGVTLGPCAVESAGPSRLGAAIAELAADPGRRATMSRLGRVLVDGDGAERAVSALTQVAVA